MPEANVTVEIIGRTAEFNDIVLLKAAKPATEPVFRADDNKFIDEVPEKKIIFIVHGLSVMGVDKLSVFKNSTSYSKLFSYYFEHLDKFDIFILPMANPDGYAFAMGDAVLYPNGYTDAHSNDDKYIDLKGDIDEAMKNATFKYTGVTVDTIYKWYGKVLGTSVDYASKVYPGRDLTSDNEEEVEDIALREIWGRIINVIFKSFWKNMHMNDIQ
ncbi:putative structural component of insect carboxypeptidase [Operophtera brumata]|uniref:Putative structural component of insect carboxypeptidase n=1 Tax=Operophtera brumata TaxID=104452 RepID=A0A0L7L0H2_OPEBR|nr:putative structural component of insect carboxypeptidase [Operophtera brumata]